ncbi:MAG: hypothetical protein LPK02_03060 [Rhodobacterales bacterium]|nr:hypothetical protein [Rhodobacterales bacterium]MDX5412007.1 hypothetical protein [Rhodobacterales bacterium]
MSPQNRPRSHPDRLAVPVHAPCHDRAAALDLLQDLSFPDAFSVELWLDRIESRNGREMRP